MQVDLDREPAFERLLRHLQATYALDFTSHRRASLVRRISRRMQACGCDDPQAYLAQLHSRPAELAALCRDLFVNVTAFFRDTEAWTHLATTIVPAVVRRKWPERSIRLWSVGCASGEEPISLAILFAEALGLEACSRRLKIYATDADEVALEVARKGEYGEAALRSLPVELRRKYFRERGDAYVLHPDLRETIVFGRQDVLHDAPISRVDLVACRNLLMYFEADAQRHVLHRLHFALDDGGYLFLGRSDTVLVPAELFTAIELEYRVFARRRVLGRPGPLRPGPSPASSALQSRPLLEAAFDTAPVATCVVDADGRMVACNAAARSLLGSASDDLESPVYAAKLASCPIDLSRTIERTAHQRVPLRFEAVAWPGDDERYYDVVVAPIVQGETQLGTIINFIDVTQHQQTCERLRRTNDDLETSHEQLRSRNRELEFANAELQLAIEEYATVVEGLRTENDRLRVSQDDFALTEGLQTPVAVVNREGDVCAWSRGCEALFGCSREQALGRPLRDIARPWARPEVSRALECCFSEQRVERVHVGGAGCGDEPLELTLSFTPAERAAEQLCIIEVEPEANETHLWHKRV